MTGTLAPPGGHCFLVSHRQVSLPLKSHSSKQVGRPPGYLLPSRRLPSLLRDVTIQLKPVIGLPRWLEVPATKLGDLNLIPETHMAEEQNQLIHDVS